MAAKIQCPECGKMLKEYGDEMKDAQGCYRVYDSLPNSIEKQGEHRLLECLQCRYVWEI